MLVFCVRRLGEALRNRGSRQWRQAAGSDIKDGEGMCVEQGKPCLAHLDPITRFRHPAHEPDNRYALRSVWRLAMTKTKQWVRTGIAMALMCGASAAIAQVKIGVTLSTTGPAASLGIPEKNTIALLPKEIGGKTVQYIILDDASDTGKAVQNTRKLIDEDHVDAIIGSTVTPNSLAMLDPASEGKTPVISLAASAAIISPMDAKRAWAFKPPQNDSLMADAIADYMEHHGVKTVGFIGFADAYGDSWNNVFTAAANAHNLKIVSNERFNRTDASVTGQVLKTMGANPDRKSVV